MHILLAEDDPSVAEYVTRGFTEAGHVVDALADGRQAMIQALQGEYDVFVFDRMMPGMDGMALLKSLRAAGDRTPAIFLTAVSGVDDRVEGLEAGADDYLTKPFAFSELLARVNALARRPAATAGETVKLVRARSRARPAHARRAAAATSRSSCSRASSRCWRC